MATQHPGQAEFEWIAAAVLRTERISDRDLERLARRARRGDASASRSVVEQTLRHVVARVHANLEVGADPMELFEVGSAVLGEAPNLWHPRQEAFADKVDRLIQDQIQPLLDEATRRNLFRAATALHGQRPQPHPVDVPLPLVGTDA